MLILATLLYLKLGLFNPNVKPWKFQPQTYILNSDQKNVFQPTAGRLRGEHHYNLYNNPVGAHMVKLL